MQWGWFFVCGNFVTIKMTGHCHNQYKVFTPKILLLLLELFFLSVMYVNRLETKCYWLKLENDKMWNRIRKWIRNSLSQSIHVVKVACLMWWLPFSRQPLRYAGLSLSLSQSCYSFLSFMLQWISSLTSPT